MDQLQKKSKVLLFGSTLIILIASVIGIFKLEVENSFINYFDKETEIYKGMKKIDDDLGGTTPLNVILKFPKKQKRKLMTMNFLNGMKILIAKRKNQNIGLQEIKWIKFCKFMII